MEHWHTRNMDQAGRTQFDMWMSRPLPGEQIRDDDPVWGDDALSAGFSTLQSQMSRGGTG